MAGSRPRFQIIGRSDGRSACAVAAYRAGVEIECQTYGKTFDYTRKQGVLHAEIISPEKSPAWVSDRSKLWNAVEQSELKKDGTLKVSAQLAREIAVPLAHELDFETNRAALHEWITEQFVSRGMIADFAIHAPSRDGDQRNHHAHVMLTMREITPDGFHPTKATETARSWNKTELLESSIDRWRDIQNRDLERAGLDVRVDFSSFESRGIDREAERHEGPAATSLKRRGEPSRIVSDNAQRQERNSARADQHVALLKDLAYVAAARVSFEQWASFRQNELQLRQAKTREDMEAAHGRIRSDLEEELQSLYQPHLKTVEQEAKSVQSRLEGTGIFARVRRFVFGRKDREKLEELQASIRQTKDTIQATRDALQVRQAVEKARLAQAQQERLQDQHEGIERARDRKEQSFADRLTDAHRQASESLSPEVRSIWERAAEPPDKTETPKQENTQAPERGNER